MTKNQNYLFTSESVSEGHPDKVADQVSDQVLDNILAYDNDAHVACETFVTTGLCVIGGEISTNTYVNLKDLARQTINSIGYNKSEYKFDGDGCGVMNVIQEQSSDINQGVSREVKEDQGAGDQGIIFGYATNETPTYTPLPHYLATKILKKLSEIRKEGQIMTYLRPDSKSQVTIEYDKNHKPLRIDTIVVSTQHDEFNSNDDIMLETIHNDIINIVIPSVVKELPSDIQKLFGNDIKYFINPTGKFVIGGPHGDTGLTGRKIIVDTYGGKCPHGGGAFSGKDPSKVDRSGAYMCRYIAKNLVASGLCSEVTLQVGYAIGVKEPVSLWVETKNKTISMSDGEISKKLLEIFDLTPYGIEKTLNLRQPMYFETSSYGHFGRKNEVVTKTFHNQYEGDKTMEVELFTWEKLDKVDEIKKVFGL